MIFLPMILNPLQKGEGGVRGNKLKENKIGNYYSA